LRIIIGLPEFSTFAGTETYTLAIATELVRLGHEVTVHAQQAGTIAAIARDRGVSVTTEPSRLPEPDAVLVQDAASAYELAERYPDARRVLIAHSDYYMLQSPPQLPGVCHAVVVLNDRVGRHLSQLATPPRLVRFHQPVDLKAFGARGGQPQRARRALILGNYLRGSAADTVAGACRDAGLEPILSGVHTTPTDTPAQAIADAEIVIGLGRCIVEAMAGRRAAYVYGVAGGDGWVTPDNYAELEADGFGGTATDLTVDRARLAADLAAWNPEMGPLNRQLAHRHHDVVAHAAELVALLRDLKPDSDGPALDHAGELARLVRLEWQSWSRYAGNLIETRTLRELLEERRVVAEGDKAELASTAAEADQRAAAIEHLRAELGQVHAELEQVRADLERATAAAESANRDRDAERARWEAFQATRRFRLAAILATPLDAMRRGRGGTNEERRS
jgi:hypothetical protein